MHHNYSTLRKCSTECRDLGSVCACDIYAQSVGCVLRSERSIKLHVCKLSTVRIRCHVDQFTLNCPKWQDSKVGGNTMGCNKNVFTDLLKVLKVPCTLCVSYKLSVPCP